MFTLFVVCLPVDINEGLCVHAVDVEDAVQVVHLVLDDPGRPATSLPRYSFAIFIETCRVRRQKPETKAYLTNVDTLK